MTKREYDEFTREIRAGQVELQTRSDEAVEQAGTAEGAHRSDDRRLGKNCPNCFCTYYTRHKAVGNVKLCAYCGCHYTSEYMAPSVLADIKREVVQIGTLVADGDGDHVAFSILVASDDEPRRVHGFFRPDTKEVVQYG